MTARTDALAFRIWAYCTPRGWDCDLREIADALGVSWHSVRGACIRKGWSNRLRTRKPDYAVGFHQTKPRSAGLIVAHDFDAADYSDLGLRQ